MGWFSILKIGNTYPSPRYTTFMVHDNVWNSANMINNVGGIRELEMSLGRELTEKDFTDAPVNWADLYWNENRAKNAPSNIKADEINADTDSIKRKKEILGEEGRKKLARSYLNSDRPNKYPDRIKEAERILGVV
tara:strand:+ start:594 stop:998 length:405 start_codon:yes stop_codon:yes gene_type:complete